MGNQKISWEELRAQLRQLERTIEGNVTELIRIRQGGSQPYENGGISLSQANVETANALKTRIGDDLGKASSLMESIGPLSSAHGAQYTRFKQIFTDLGREAHLAFNSIDEAYRKLALLGGQPNVQGPSQDEAYLLRERNAVDTSLEMLDATIAQGSSTVSSFHRQNTGLRGVSRKVINIGSQLPGANQLIVKIRHSQLKSHIVLAIATGTCIFLLLLYVFRK